MKQSDKRLRRSTTRLEKCSGKLRPRSASLRRLAQEKPALRLLRVRQMLRLRSERGQEACVHARRNPLMPHKKYTVTKKSHARRCARLKLLENSLIPLLSLPLSELQFDI